MCFLYNLRAISVLIFKHFFWFTFWVIAIKFLGSRWVVCLFGKVVHIYIYIYREKKPNDLRTWRSKSCAEITPTLN